MGWGRGESNSKGSRMERRGGPHISRAKNARRIWATRGLVGVRKINGKGEGKSKSKSNGKGKGKSKSNGDRPLPGLPCDRVLY